MQLGHVEQLPLDRIGVRLEPRVGAKPRAGGPPQLPAHPLLLGGNVLHALRHELVMAFMAGLRRSVRRALRRGEDLQRRLGDDSAVPSGVGERVVAVLGAHEQQHALGPRCGRRVRARREHHVGKRGNRLFQSGVAVDGVFPDLQGVGGQVDLAVGVPVQDSGVLVVQVEDGLVIGFVLEERLVGAHHLGVLLEPRPHPPAQLDDALDAVGRQEGMAQYLARVLADAVDAPGALDDSDDRPRQVVVHDDGAVLQVLPLAQHVGRDQDPEFLRRVWKRTAVAHRTEAARELGRVLGVAGDAGDRLHAHAPELRVEVAHGVGELGEDQHFLVREGPGEQLTERAQLGVVLRVPGAVLAEDAEQRFGVFLELPFQEAGGKEVRRQPIEPLPVVGAVPGIDFRGAPLEAPRIGALLLVAAGVRERRLVGVRVGET